MRVGIIVGVVVAIILVVFISSFGASGLTNVAVVPIKGVITIEGESGFGASGTSSDDIVRFLEQIQEDKSIQAVVLEINSPGGSAVASDEIVQAIRELEIPVVAWIREIGASGGYWVAAEADHVIANRISITGSVGVIASYLEFNGFLNDNNITYRRIAVGDDKDIGSPFAELSERQENLLLQKLELTHEFFLDDVQESRGLTQEQRDEIASGIIYLGTEAKDLNLVDELGGKKEVEAWLTERVDGELRYERYESQGSFLDELLGTSSWFDQTVKLEAR